MKILKLALLLIPIAGLARPASKATISLHTQQIAELGTGTVRQIAWSPDGSILAASASKGIWFFDPNTPQQPPERLQEAAQDIAFSPDGQHLAAAMGDSIRIWDLQNHTSQIINAKQMA